MTDERDPALQTLFADATEELAGKAFTAQVMSRIDGRRQTAWFAWISVALVLAACAWLLALPLQEAAHFLTQSLTLSLIDLDDRLLAQLVSPLNSVAGALALGLIGLRIAYRRIFA